MVKQFGPNGGLTEEGFLAIWLIMLSGGSAVLQAPMFDGLSFDPFSLQQDGLAAPEVGIGRRDVLQIAGRVVVLQQDAVLKRLVPALDLALSLRMIGGSFAVSIRA